MSNKNTDPVVIRSDENRVKTDLIWTALSFAKQELENEGIPNMGPRSTLGLLERAILARAEELKRK